MGWLDNVKNHFKDGACVSGLNLNPSEVKFGGLTDTFGGYLSEEEKDVLKRFERIIISIMEDSQDIVPESLVVKNNTVVIPEDSVSHCCYLNLTSLEGISKAGVLCSEWFGIPETQGEAIFCAFLSEPKGRNENEEEDSIELYFDKNNPLMQMLLENDYFDYIKRKNEIRREIFEKLSENEKNEFYEKAVYEYLKKHGFTDQMISSEKHKQNVERCKKIAQENLDKLIIMYPYLLGDDFEDNVRKTMKEKYNYSDIILDFYNKIVEPNSPHSKLFHDNPNNQQYYWKAIPGGIPSQLINGVKITRKKSEDITPGMIDKIQKMYPNAIIFDKNNRVLSRPQKKNNSR